MHRPRSHDPPLRHWPRHFRTQAAVSQASSNPLAAEAAALASGTRARTGVVGKWQVVSEGAWKPHRHQHQDVSLTVLSGPHRGGAAVVVSRGVDRQRRGAGEQGDHGEQKQQQQRRAATSARMRVLAVVLSLATLQAAEQRILTVEAPSSTVVADPLAVASEPSVVEASAVPPPSTVQLTVRASDVEALDRFLRAHYRRAYLRAYPTTHLDAALAAADQCDPNECYSNCYLQGFRGGNCKENKCFCTQVPPAPPVNLDAS